MMENKMRCILFTVLFSFLICGQSQQMIQAAYMDVNQEQVVSAWHGELGLNAIQMDAHTNLPNQQHHLTDYFPPLPLNEVCAVDLAYIACHLTMPDSKSTLGFLTVRQYQSNYLSPCSDERNICKQNQMKEKKK